VVLDRDEEPWSPLEIAVDALREIAHGGPDFGKGEPQEIEEYRRRVALRALEAINVLR